MFATSGRQLPSARSRLCSWTPALAFAGRSAFLRQRAGVSPAFRLVRPPFRIPTMRRALPSQIGGFPIRLFAVVVGAVGLAVPAVLVAVAGLVLRPPSASEWGGIGLFLVLAMAADFRPVPLDEEGNEVSLAFVFIIAELLLFGWRAAVPTAALSVLVPELARRRPLLRAAFNSASYALAATGAALPLLAVDGIRSYDAYRLTLAAFLCGAVYLLVNVLLVARAASLAQGASYARVFVENLRYGGAAFG